MAGYVATWQTNEFINEMDKAVAKGVGRAAQYLVRRIKERISRPGVKKTTPFGSTNIKRKSTPPTLRMKLGKLARKYTSEFENTLSASYSGTVLYAGGKRRRRKSTPRNTLLFGKTPKSPGSRVPRGTAGGDIVRISRPGEPPRMRLGLLRNSIRAEKHNRSGTVYRVGSTVRYAAALELGTSRGLKPRPYLRTTLAAERNALRNAIITGIKSTKFLRPLHGTPSSSELTNEDVARGRKNVHFAEPPAMGEM